MVPDSVHDNQKNKQNSYNIDFMKSSTLHNCSIINKSQFL